MDDPDKGKAILKSLESIAKKGLNVLELNKNGL